VVSALTYKRCWWRPPKSPAESLFDELGVDELVSLFTQEGLEVVDTAIEHAADSLEWLASRAADASQTLEDVSRLYRNEVAEQALSVEPAEAPSHEQEAAMQLERLAEGLAGVPDDAIQDPASKLEELAAGRLSPSADAIQATQASVVLPNSQAEEVVKTVDAGNPPTDPRGAQAPEPSPHAMPPR
jgi:hypothetical protein